MMLRNRLHRVTMPALVIRGEKDNFVPRARRNLRTVPTNCGELKIIPGAGHSAKAENPEQAVKLVLDFRAA